MVNNNSGMEQRWECGAQVLMARERLRDIY
jgi:hypothetical protein